MNDDNTKLILEAISNLYSTFDNLQKKFDNLQKTVDVMQENVNALQENVERNNLLIENTINTCVKALGEGQKLNAERFDRYDIIGVHAKIENAAMLAKIANDRIDMLERKQA